MSIFVFAQRLDFVLVMAGNSELIGMCDPPLSFPGLIVLIKILLSIILISRPVSYIYFILEASRRFSNVLEASPTRRRLSYIYR